MNKHKQKILFVILGLLIGILFCLPYIIFKEQIKELALVGYLGLVAACALSTVSILLPSSSTMITLVAANTLNPVICIVLGALGATIGEQSSYICGRVGRIGFGNDETNNKLSAFMSRHQFLTVFIFALMPLPVFDVGGIMAGAFKMNWLVYSGAAFLGKLLKYTLFLMAFWYLVPMLLPQLPDPVSNMLSDVIETIGLTK